MSVNFFQSNQKDTFGTLLLSICIVSRFIPIYQSSDFLKFTVLASILALGFNIFFDLIKILFFRFWDLGKYKSRGRFEYAWNHNDFHEFKVNFLFNIRLMTGLMFLSLPNNTFSLFNLNMTESFIFQNIFSSNLFGSISVSFLILVIGLTLYNGNSWYVKLRTVKIFNSIDNWNSGTRVKIRENSWDEVATKMNEVYDNTTKLLANLNDEFKLNISKFKSSNPNLAEFIFYYIYENEERNWRKTFQFEYPKLEFLKKDENLIPLLNEYLSGKIVQYTKDMIKLISYGNDFLMEPISAFKEKNQLDFYLNIFEFIELLLILYLTPFQTYKLYFPEVEGKFTKERLKPIRNVVMDQLIVDNANLGFEIDLNKGNDKFLTFLYLINNKKELFKGLSMKNFPYSSEDFIDYFSSHEEYKTCMIKYGEQMISFETVMNKDFLDTRLYSINENFFNSVTLTFVNLKNGYYETLRNIINLNNKIVEELDRLFKYGAMKVFFINLFITKKNKFYYLEDRFYSAILQPDQEEKFEKNYKSRLNSILKQKQN